MNIIAGIMPLQHMELRTEIAMGTDIAGGHGIGIYRQVARAVQLSKLKEFYEHRRVRPLPLHRHSTMQPKSLEVYSVRLVLSKKGMRLMLL